MIITFLSATAATFRCSRTALGRPTATATGRSASFFLQKSIRYGTRVNGLTFQNVNLTAKLLSLMGRRHKLRE